MAKYFYTARDATGKKVIGSEDVPSEDELISRLQAQNLIVIDVSSAYKEGVVEPKAVTEKREQTKIKFHSKKGHGRVTTQDLMLFCRQLTTLLGAGVTILKSLDIITKQVSSRKLFEVIKGLQKHMEAGLSLHEAMAKFPKVFSELWVNLVESGEASGNLPVVLNRLASYLERNAAFKAKIISALIYPCILLVAGTGALLFLTIKIIPTFAEIFDSFNVTLPFITLMLIKTSDILRKYLVVFIVIVVSGYFTFRQYIRTPMGRRQWESFLLKLPAFGDFYKALLTERFSSEMSTLIESGVPIMYALEIVERSVGNLTMGDIIKDIKEAVRDGKSLNKPFDDSGFFEPMVTQMVSVGEEIGELPQMFKRINTFYQEYVETALARFTSMFEPLMLVFIGGVIGIMVVGMFLPIFKLTQMRG
ncbi:MAG: type II secretion system F family protein [Candidatus Omnitrophota bacterium]|jgi:type II secretory pathway component PulF|nr:MAG: type II secretion system F family protein [Candidatus Omnitrophota bacterium]